MSELAYLMSDCARLLRRAFDARVREAGVTGQQARLLLTVNRSEGERQSFYADALDVEPITLARMVDRMAEAGLIERHPDPTDRRAWLLRLTRQGHTIVPQLRQCATLLEAEIASGLEGSEYIALKQILALVHHTMTNRTTNQTHG